MLPPNLDPYQLSVENKIKLVQDSDGLLVELLEGLQTIFLELNWCSSLTHLPEGLKIKYLCLNWCASLVRLPEKLQTHELRLMGCTSLVCLPKGLQTDYLYLNGCTSLRDLPQDLKVNNILDATGCTGLQHLRKQEIKGINKTIWEW